MSDETCVCQVPKCAQRKSIWVDDVAASAAIEMSGGEFERVGFSP